MYDEILKINNMSVAYTKVPTKGHTSTLHIYVVSRSARLRLLLSRTLPLLNFIALLMPVLKLYILCFWVLNGAFAAQTNIIRAGSTRSPRGDVIGEFH